MDLPKHLTEILIDENWEIKQIESIKEGFDRNYHLENSTIYRTEQLNVTRIEDDIKSYSQLKKEYEIKSDFDKHIISVKLNDFFYEFNPPALSRIFDFISEVDYIRNDCTIQLNEQGRFLKILNKKSQYKNWNNFKSNRLNEIEFINVVRQSKPTEYVNLIKQGDLQFSEEYEDSKDFNRDLFYFVILDKYLYNSSEKLESENLNYQSQLFPDVVIPMKLRYDIIKKENDLITIRKVWETIESNDLLENISNAYEKYHQPLIKYKFTNYKLDMRCLLSYNEKTKILENAELNIIENVENNIKSECVFNLKKIER